MPFRNFFTSRRDYVLLTRLDADFAAAVRGDQHKIKGTDACLFVESYKALIWSKTNDMAQVIEWMRELLPDAYSAAGSIRAIIMDGRKEGARAARKGSTGKAKAHGGKQGQGPVGAGTAETGGKPPACGDAKTGAPQGGENSGAKARPEIPGVAPGAGVERVAGKPIGKRPPPKYSWSQLRTEDDWKKYYLSHPEFHWRSRSTLSGARRKAIEGMPPDEAQAATHWCTFYFQLLKWARRVEPGKAKRGEIYDRVISKKPKKLPTARSKIGWDSDWAPEDWRRFAQRRPNLKGKAPCELTRDREKSPKNVSGFEFYSELRSWCTKKYRSAGEREGVYSAILPTKRSCKKLRTLEGWIAFVQGNPRLRGKPHALLLADKSAPRGEMSGRHFLWNFYRWLRRNCRTANERRAAIARVIAPDWRIWSKLNTVEDWLAFKERRPNLAGKTPTALKNDLHAPPGGVSGHNFQSSFYKWVAKSYGNKEVRDEVIRRVIPDTDQKFKQLLTVADWKRYLSSHPEFLGKIGPQLRQVPGGKSLLNSLYRWAQRVAPDDPAERKRLVRSIFFPEGGSLKHGGTGLSTETGGPEASTEMKKAA
jgi:hypothetical protein